MAILCQSTCGQALHVRSMNIPRASTPELAVHWVRRVCRIQCTETRSSVDHSSDLKNACSPHIHIYIKSPLFKTGSKPFASISGF